MSSLSHLVIREQFKYKVSLGIIYEILNIQISKTKIHLLIVNMDTI